MIEINLLPEDLRVAERSTTGMRLVFFIGIPLLCILVISWVWLHVVVYSNADKIRNEVKKTEQRKKTLAAKVNALLGEVNKMKEKGITVKNLRNLRKRDWVRKLMDLTMAVNGTHGWLSSIKLTLGGGKGTIALGGQVIGKDQKGLSNNVKDFYYQLGYINGDRKSGFNEFWKDFISYTPDHYFKGIKNPRQKDNWLFYEFNLKLEIKPEVAKDLCIIR